jgi:hypothetical protein
VLVVRTDSLPVALSYPDVLSAELLPMQVAATMMLSVGDVHAFRRRFMLQDGVVTTANLADILRGSVRQALAEVIGARHVDEMAADPLFRDKLDAALRKKLDPLLADLGLALMQVSEITLCHEALDEQNRLKGRLWLVRREMQVHDAHDKSLDEIYDQRQWAAIKRREAEIRRRRHEATLSKDEAEIAQTLRLLDQEKYQQIADAQTREQAIRMGAADEIGRLEQEYAGKRRHREKQALGEQYRDDAESEDWKNLQALARIKCDGERRAAEITASSLASFESERVERELEKLRIQGQLDALALVHDAAERQERELALRQQEQERVGLMRDLARRQHEAALVDIDLMVESKQANAARIQAWEEELLIAKVRKLKDEAAVAASDQRIEPTASGWR